MISPSLFYKINTPILIVLMTFAIAINLQAATYYVALNGSDSNNGLSTSNPWKTITKVNSMMSTFNGGDQILFKKGDKFLGSVAVTKSGTTGNNILFGNYGTGNNPVITGEKVITGWSNYSGSIYRASVSDTITQVYISGKIINLARYPNSGFLKIDAGTGSNGFYDAALTQSGGYWNGATCKVRTVNWIYEKKVVSAFSGGNITFSTVSQNVILPDYGYYFDNKLNLLDTENEWFYDKATSYLYLYAPGGVNPSSLTVEGIAKKNGFNMSINVSNITIQDLNIIGYKESTVDAYTGNNIIVQRCYLSHSGRFGIRLNGINNIANNNTLEDNLNVAINGNFTGGEIKNNILNRNGLKPGYGEDGFGYCGILLFVPTGVTVEGNTIDSTGYSGINVGNNTIVKNNVISYSLLTLNDGGGIAVGNSDGLQVVDNIINNSIGNTESSNDPVSYANGIYVNFATVKNTLIQGNTVYANRNVGLIVDMKSTSTNNVIRSNVFYNNFSSQILFSDYSDVNFANHNTLVKGNTFYSLQAEQYCMRQIMFNNPTFSDYGNFDSNYYSNPYSEYVINKTMIYGIYNSSNYTLSQWKTNSGEDLNSKTSIYMFDQYAVTDTLSSNLMANSNFNSGIGNWSTWPAGSQITSSTHPVLDAGVMRIDWT
ncbi:MAG: right-handed parallel beta-helix repeat-containing protein, partial [Ignavibacteria bacterium]